MCNDAQVWPLTSSAVALADSLLSAIVRADGDAADRPSTALAGTRGWLLRLRRFANVLQCLFAEYLGIALSVLGQGDEFVGDCLFDVIVPRVQGDADHFECPTYNAPGLKVEIIWAGEIGGD